MPVDARPGDRALATLWGFWLGCAPFVFLAAPLRQPLFTYDTVDTRPDTPLVAMMTIAIIAAGIVPAAITTATRRMDFARGLPFMASALAILIVVTLSLLGSTDPADLAKPVLGFYVLGVVWLLVAADIRRPVLLSTMLQTYALTTVCAAAAAVIDGNFVYGRFMGRLGPNYWGGACAYALLAALVIRRMPLRALTILGLLGVLALSQNRSSMIAVVAGCLVALLLAWLRGDARDRLLLMLGVVVAGAVLVPLAPTIATDVLMIDDPRRGIDSGGTGRSEAWAEAWQVFVDHPLLGVGYRHHEQYITAASSAHEAYLATAADMGVIGVCLYLGLVLVGLVQGFRVAYRHRSPGYATLLAIIAAYAVQGFAEQRAINFANSVSLMFLVAFAFVITAPPAKPGAGVAP